MYSEDDLLPLSGLQHLMFCERQWGLIHIEQMWEENRLTAEGRVLHERAHQAGSESRPKVRTSRGLRLHSLRLGLVGQADVVEFHPFTDGVVLPELEGLWRPFPVEYKRGRPKKNACDEVQLCAQALCLEEMFGDNILDIPSFLPHTWFMETTATTLQGAIIWFSEFEHCRKFVMELRWPDGIVKCPQCEATNVTWLAKARVWKCYAKHERPTFSLKTGTIFEDSPIALEKWLTAAWLIISCKNGISSYELHRGLGVTQKTAWFMNHRIRLAMQEGGFGKMSGTVEADETFIGGKARNMHASQRAEKIHGRGPMGKQIVFGLLERKTGRVHVEHVETRRKHDLSGVVQQRVRRGSEVITDELLSYDALNNEYAHKVINHAEQYVDGHVHTNRMENFWSLLKRGINGTYVSVEPFHLFRYLDEQAFRYNNRTMTDAERFASVMKQIVGRRLTYAELTGKTESQPGPRP